MTAFTESVVEQAALAWLEAAGWQVAHGPDIAPDMPAAERRDYGEVVLAQRLRDALARLNPTLPVEALADAFRKLTRPEGAELVARNRALHRLLVDGVTVEYRTAEGEIRGAQARVIDFDQPSANDWLAVNQFSVTDLPAGQAGNKHTRRPDLVLFVNGLAVAVVELKNAADESATIWSAWQQLQTYKAEVPALFATNALLVISDGVEARVGTLTAGREWFKPWRTITGADFYAPPLPSPQPSPSGRGSHNSPPSTLGRGGGGDGQYDLKPELEVVLLGVFDPQRLLDLIRDFIVYEDDGGGRVAKKMAGYHQFHAVQVAVGETLRAAELHRASNRAGDRVAEAEGRYEAGKQPGGKAGDRRVGVVWHTQGSGKSLTMAFYAGRIIRERAMENPTLVVLTDRNDLDDQLFATFSRCKDLLRQPPVQAESRAHLRELLTVASGGVVFTTIQKFMSPAAPPSPQPSPRGRGGDPPAAPPSPQPSPRGRGGQYRGGYEFAGLVERARQLRRQPTTAEELMWSMLCERQFLSLKFRRQHQIGDYIVDFCCHDAMLVVELDGGVHDSQERSRADSRRDAYLMSLGFTVHRVPNERLLGDPASVLSDLARHLPSPAGRGVGGEGPLSLRPNVVVIADEAHRSQYDFIDGYARHLRDALPNASFIGFTGTPIELQDANTRAVFGDYISVYDIQRAVADGATVPIYYESRLAKLALDEAERPKIDPEFEEATEGEEVERKEKLKTRWAQLEAVVGAEKRLAIVARDIVDHFETRCEALEGKAMVVCMSRRICVELYREIVKLRPQWASDDDALGAIKVVMTGQAADPADWQPHIRNKPRREALANRFRDAADSLRLVLVRDMWLTGFDAPSLSTMYLDKPMRGHGLMQAIARVNRVFKDKPGGLVVDYLGLAQELKAALATYTESGGMGSTALDQDEAVAVMLEKYEVCCDLFGSFTTPKGVVGGFDWAKWTTGTPQERLGLLPPAQEHILRQDNGKERCVRAVRELSQAFALAVPHAEALRIRDDVAFFQAVQAVLAKRAPGDARPEEELDHAVRRIISRAVAPEGVMDIFAAAGLQKPDLSILSDEFLAEVRGMPQRNLAVELLQKLLKGEIATRRRKNVVQARSFAKMLGETIRRYQNRAIEAAQVIEELIKLAREMREASARGERFRLSEDELAFYDALETNDSAVKVLGDETLRAIARELVETVRKNVTIDWTLRENVRAQLRVLVKRILRNHGYPPDKQEKATQTVLEQAALLSGEWAGA